MRQNHREPHLEDKEAHAENRKVVKAHEILWKLQQPAFYRLYSHKTLSMVFIGVTKMLEYLSVQEYRHIVRIVGNDIPGAKKVLVGLTQIKGIGYNFATAVLDTLNIDVNSNIGFLRDDQVQAIEKLITDPIAANFPPWFLNRRKDIETGKDMHLLTSDIPFTLRNDIERERVANSWRGYRHLYGLKVRGQRTRTTGRKGGAVGVAKGGKAAPVKPSGPSTVAAPTGEAVTPVAEKKEVAEEK